RELGVVAERFGVGVGSYPNSGGPTRIKLTGGDPAALDEAMAWFRANATVDLYESESAVEAARDGRTGSESPEN
ncbi:competence/damage-inducible protein A, partial [Salinisphaera sp. USBA-960]|nr:competence/damage-inducible protein A [Salifodinibacter halophilus]